MSGLNSSFNRVAKDYDEVRPGYPEELIEDIIEITEFPRNGRILEVGCGTGQATTQLARRGSAGTLWVCRLSAGSGSRRQRGPLFDL